MPHDAGRISRSIELIVQPAAKDAIGEMAVRGDLRAGPKIWIGVYKGVTRSDACGVERAKVHVETFYFPSPTGNCQHSLRAVAHHPTGINLRMTEGLGIRERRTAKANEAPADVARSLQIYLAIR